MDLGSFKKVFDFLCLGKIRKEIILTILSCMLIRRTRRVELRQCPRFLTHNISFKGR